MSEPVCIGLVLPSLLRQLADECESAAMGPAAAVRRPEGARPATSEASEDTQPAGKGPIEAEGSGPQGSRATVGRSASRGPGVL